MHWGVFTRGDTCIADTTPGFFLHPGVHYTPSDCSTRTLTHRTVLQDHTEGVEADAGANNKVAPHQLQGCLRQEPSTACAWSYAHYLLETSERLR